ncbi:MAG: RIP metalloprotease RseP [Deltaproteobacteria bacterium]|nr:RIP metalloprotease RseP [Deltaproteobacteria bacterium]
MTGLTTIIVSVVILLGILIFVHELGHFLVAKYSGVGVLKFSLGFGPKLIGKKMGETEYILSAIPLGGYVKLLGESEVEELTDEDEKRSFLKQPVWKRIAIVVAGPLFNFVLAVVVFAFVYMWGIPAMTTKVGGVQEGSAAFEAGLEIDDVIVAVGDKKVSKWPDMAKIISSSNGETLKITLEKNGRLTDVMITPRLMKSKNIFGEEIESYKIGISPSEDLFIERMNPIAACWSSLVQTWVITKLTILSIIKIIEGAISPRTLGGPILIAQIAGDQAKAGLIPFLMFMGLLSINLGILNLLPIPVLDGGHLAFYLIELITGREISIKWRERAQQIGFVILIALMIFVIIMDIDRMNNPRVIEEPSKTIQK